jgi:hypothetical protein
VQGYRVENLDVQVAQSLFWANKTIQMIKTILWHINIAQNKTRNDSLRVLGTIMVNFAYFWAV